MNSKVIIFIVLVAIIAIASLGFLYMLQSKNNTVPEKVDEEIKNPPSVMSLLTVINSNVQVKPFSLENFQEVKGNAQVTQGDTVKTSLTGRAVLESENSTTVVDKNSEIIIKDQSENNKTTIQIESGSLWSRIEKFFGQGEYYQVQTPNSVAAVRGTSFGVSYINFVTVILVAEGQVTVISIDPITKEQIGGEVIVIAGQKATIVNGKAPFVQVIGEVEKRSEWYQFNQPQGINNPTVPTKKAPSSSITPQPPATATNTSSQDSNLMPVPDSTVNSTNNQTTTAQSTQTETTNSSDDQTTLQIQNSQPTLRSVDPLILYINNYDTMDFRIYGNNLESADGVFLNDINISFYVANASTIVANAYKGIQPGTYDVSVIFLNSEKIILQKALVIR